MTTSSAIDLSKYFECQWCEEWREIDEHGNCTHCNRLIAPKRQGPDAGNDLAYQQARFGVE